MNAVARTRTMATATSTLRVRAPTLRALGVVGVQRTRALTSPASNRWIYIHPSHANTASPKPSKSPSQQNEQHILSLLSSTTASPSLAIGTTTSIPPTPSSFTENPRFLDLLNEVLAQHAVEDPGVQSQAAAFATSSTSIASPGYAASTSSTGSAPGRGRGSNSGGGAGGGGVGGWLHVSDSRAPPDFGRIAWPEDIFGSLEVDRMGRFVEERGNWQASGTYRIVTRDGILGLSDFLMGKLVERLEEEQKKQSIS